MSIQFDVLLKEKEVFVIGLDDEIYPQKDYLLQVYYLFAQFMEYSLQMDANAVLSFMTAYYQENGVVGIFPATADAFSIPVSYQENFINLHTNARLPLKLLLYKEILEEMQAIVTERKTLVLFVAGPPEMQLNKIKQIEWNGLETYIKVYFLEELNLSGISAIEYLANELAVIPAAICWWRQ